MTEELLRTFAEAVFQAQYASSKVGELGKQTGTNTYDLQVDLRPNRVYVTLYHGTGAMVTDAINGGVPLIPNFPVRIIKIPGNDRLAVPDWARAAYFIGENSGGLGVGPHSHSLSSGLGELVEALRIIPGLVHAYSGTVVLIREFAYQWSGTNAYFSGAYLDLSSYLPTTTDKWAWILIGVDPSTNTATAATGTEYDKQTDLFVSLINSIDFTDKIPLCAVQAQEGDTDLSDITRWQDYRLGWATGMVSSETATGLDKIMTDANGDIMVDANGNVMTGA